MTPILTCYIIDDEQPARAVLEKFVRRVPFLNLVGQHHNAVEALLDVQQLRPDLILLDVEMPEMTGVEFLKALTRPRPQVILITASPEYAVAGFELDVLDYLLKPVAFERFVRAINKALPNHQPLANKTDNQEFKSSTQPAPATAEPARPVTQTPSFFLVKEDKKLVKVTLADIVFVEAMKDYLTIHLTDRTVFTALTLQRVEEMLPTSQFLRVNRSYIVRKEAIAEIDGNLITTTDGKRVPIGVTYRDSVWKAINPNIL
jgi:two-component system, LytTR family, response regulator